MKTFLDCYPCILRQAIEAMRMVGVAEERQYQVLHQVLGLMAELEPSLPPPYIAGQVHKLLKDETGNDDPYLAAKQNSTAEALALYPMLKQDLAQAVDPLEVAVRLSIAGNIIDFGVHERQSLVDTIERVLGQDFAINDMAAFTKNLSQAGSVLYLADNAGETVFDRILIEELDIPVSYAVKGGAVINDATLQDAQAAGLHHVAEIISSGSAYPGTVLENCSLEFRQIFDEAEMVIAKGQGNYESLMDVGRPVFFLLQVKCPIIAREIGAPLWSIVLKHGGNEKN